MIIDIHTHTFPAKIADRTIDSLSHKSHTRPFSDGTTEGLLSNMHTACIDLSVVLPVATSPEQVPKVNDASSKLNQEFDGQGLFSFGCIHPDFEDYKSELSRFSALGLSGVKLHPVYQGVALSDIRYMRIIDEAAQRGLVVITHTGFDVGYPALPLCTPQMARQVIDTIGDFPFILAHMGGWMQWEEVPEYLADTSCFLDTAFSCGKLYPRQDADGKNLQFPEEMLDTEGFMKLYKAFGAKRILFGTDSPWADPQTELAFIRSLPIPEEDRNAILGRNAERLLGLS